MATIFPRSFRSGISQASCLRVLNSLPCSAANNGSSNTTRCISRSFSSINRVAAAPATSYVRKAEGSSKPIPAKPAEKTASPASIDDQSPIKDMSKGLDDDPLILDEGSRQVDWTKSFHGLASQPFDKDIATVLLAPLDPEDVEIKPDGIVYLPEIKYRRILNKSFGPGGWGLAARGETIVTGRSVTREYALIAHSRLVSVSRGEMDYFSPEGIPTATEGCKSNALMRCCKDLGVASELWDPRFIQKFLKERAKQIWVEHVPTKKKKQMWLRKEDEPKYPYKESKFGA